MKRIIDYVRANLRDGTVPVHATVPRNYTGGQLVTIERVGGRADHLIDYGMYAVQAWADTHADAYQLASDVRDTLIDAPAHLADIASTQVTSMYNFNDLDSRQARYQLTVAASLMMKG